DHLVTVDGVVEEVEEPRLLHEPRHEVQVRLVVLDDELARLVLLGIPPLDLIAEARLLEDRLDHLEDGLLLEDPAPLAVGERCQRWAEPPLELAARRDHADEPGLIDHAIVEAGVAGGVHDAEAEAMAEAVLDTERWALRGEADQDRIRLGDTLHR